MSKFLNLNASELSIYFEDIHQKLKNKTDINIWNKFEQFEPDIANGTIQSKVKDMISNNLRNGWKIFYQY